jgi:hypothetical protein
MTNKWHNIALVMDREKLWPFQSLCLKQRMRVFFHFRRSSFPGRTAQRYRAEGSSAHLSGCKSPSGGRTVMFFCKG